MSLPVVKPITDLSQMKCEICKKHPSEGMCFWAVCFMLLDQESVTCFVTSCYDCVIREAYIFRGGCYHKRYNYETGYEKCEKSWEAYCLWGGILSVPMTHRFISYPSHFHVGSISEAKNVFSVQSGSREFHEASERRLSFIIVM
jgi:hypothetical protein